MKVYFDISTLNPDKVTGVGVYMLQLVRHLSVHHDVKLIPLMKLSRWRQRSRLQSLLPAHIKIRLMTPWFRVEPGAVYHGPDFKLNYRGAGARVVTVHDMVVFERAYNESGFYERGILQLTKTFQQSPHAVIANSEFTKKEILKFFPRLQDRISVTHLGCERDESRVAGLVDPATPYVLFLGTLEKRKNALGVIKTFEILKSRWKGPLQLVLAGTWGFGAEEIRKALQDSPVKKDIVHLSYVESAKLAELYQNAAVFFFPSFYEGFGIPVLEAMALGCPVVTSKAEALQEISGDAALSAPADDPQALAAKLEEVLSNAALREELKTRGRARAQEFSWARCAEQTLQVYYKALERK